MAAGLPAMHIVGLPEAAVREARAFDCAARVRLAQQHRNLLRILVNGERPAEDQRQRPAEDALAAVAGEQPDDEHRRGEAEPEQLELAVVAEHENFVRAETSGPPVDDTFAPDRGD